jgi:uncharacterized protein with HEPN domain
MRDDFGPDSDVDVLVEFERDHTPGLITLAGMEIELSGILGRKADIRTPADLSRYFRQDVIEKALMIYERDDHVRLRHMLDAAHEAVAFVQDETRESLDEDRKLLLALVKAIEIIGEAASKVSESCQATYSQIPWPQIIGMRNRLIHAYFDIDHETVWQTIQDDLPPLIVELEKIIPVDDHDS